MLRKRKAGRTSSFGNSAGLNARRPFEAEKRIAALLIKAVRVRRSCASGIAFNISFQSVSSAISGKRTGKYQREQKRYVSGKGNKNKASGIVTTCLVSGGPEGDRTLEPLGCEPNALPAELQAHLFHSSPCEQAYYITAAAFCQRISPEFP